MHVELLGLILLVLVFVFEFRVLIEKTADVHLVAREDALPLVRECAFNGSQRISIVGSCVLVLSCHALDELVDVVILLAAGFDVLLVFILEVHLEL